MVKSPLQHTAVTRTDNRSRFKGVRKRKWGKWVSEVRMPNSRERIWLGTYDTPQQAARAYDAAVYCLRGRKANLNFPDTPPEIPSASSLSPEQIKAAAARIASECPWPPSSSPRPSQSHDADFSITDIQLISEEEELAFWDSLFTIPHNNYSSSSHNVTYLSAFSPPPPEAEQSDSWTWTKTRREMT